LIKGVLQNEIKEKWVRERKCFTGKKNVLEVDLVYTKEVKGEGIFSSFFFAWFTFMLVKNVPLWYQTLHHLNQYLLP
jgi:hypothetical protein